MAASGGSTALLFDLDDTLIDASAARAAIDARVRASIGEATASRFWQCYEETRAALGYADVREAMLRLAGERGGASTLTGLAEAVYGVDYAALRFPGALDALAHARTLGPTAVVTDGDPDFQRHKAHASGVAAAVEGRVLVTSRKHLELDDIALRYPADRYVVIDDKPAILAAVKTVFGDRATTVLVEQGRHARAAGAAGPPPDMRLPSIAAFAELRPPLPQTREGGG